ncbi:MAG: Xaa-Pro peptidase family protein [Acidimicrobiia bacterium]|nr:Xaa-Pro peptidase family protein [Acidimicrobiia bacterium]
MSKSFSKRLGNARAQMTQQGVDLLLLSVGADLPYFCGYEAMPLERITMLVVPRDDAATLVVPELEMARVTPYSEIFALRPWAESEDPIAIIAELMGKATSAALGDQTWSGFLVDLMTAKPNTNFRRASTITSAIRAVKDAEEIERLRTASRAVDTIAGRLQRGEIPLIGKTEAEVSAELGRQILAEGHDRVNFAIVAAGENAASPHHHAGSRKIAAGEAVLCDFGGTMIGSDGVGYCSDLTRCVWVGATPDRDYLEAYAVLHEAQAAAVKSALVGTPAQAVDQAARQRITAAGFGSYFIHRTGHGIGVEAHEDPYIIEGNQEPLVSGNAFSVEPGIYLPGCWGMRIEDIVVATDGGPDPLNLADHHLAVVEA